MRLIPQQVPEVVGRLIKSHHLRKPPTWYPAIVANPPVVLPPKHFRPRPPLDFTKPAKKRSNNIMQDGTKAVKWQEASVFKPREIIYPEDQLRRQFFTDYPFEALRPTSMVEMRAVSSEGAVSGEKWTSLAQRGSYPVVEDVIAFILNLYQNHGLNYTQAYKQATTEFTNLRAQHEVATMGAELEARWHGAEFKPDGFEREFMKEGVALDAHLAEEERLAGEGGSSRVKWKNPRDMRWTTDLRPGVATSSQFTGGRAYAEKWRRPSEAVTSTTAPAPSQAERIASSLDGEESDPEAGSSGRQEEVDELELIKQALSGSRTSP